MIDEIGLHAVVASEQVREEMLRERRLTMEQALHDRLIDADDYARFERIRRGSAMRLTRQGAFAEKTTLGKMSNYGFLADHRHHREFYFAILNKENRSGRVALRKDGFAGRVFAPRFSSHKPIKRILNVECDLLSPQSASFVWNDLQSMMRSQRQWKRATLRDPWCCRRNRSEMSSHDRYLSILENRCKGMNYRQPLQRRYNQDTGGESEGTSAITI